MASFSDIRLDSATARGLQNGDRRAQAVAYRLLSPPVMGMAVRILQDEGLAQEVVQDTFVELIEHAGSLHDAASVVGWVRKVAINHCLMRQRSPWHKRRVTVEPDEVSDLTQSSQRNDDLCDLESALGRLPGETRLVLWLHDVEGYTHREIGVLVGRSESYSKSQLARGYQKLAGIHLDEPRTQERKKLERGMEDDDTAAHLRPACSS